MPDLCHIQGAVISPEHTPLAGARVEFSLFPSQVQPSRDGVSVLAPKTVISGTNAQGAISVHLEPGLYRVTIYGADHYKYSPYTVAVPDEATAVFADIQAQLPPEPVYLNEVRASLGQIEGARVAVVAARDLVIPAAEQVAEDRVAVSEARDAAETGAGTAATQAQIATAAAAALRASGTLRSSRAEIAAAIKSASLAWQDGPAIFVADIGSTAIPDIPDVSPAPWAPVTFEHFRVAADGADWQPAIMRAQQWSAARGVPVVEPVGRVVDIMQPIQPVSGAVVLLPKDFVIRRRFMGGTTGTAMIDDLGLGVSDWNWTGGKLDGGGPAGFAGGIGRLQGENITISDVVAFDYQNLPDGGSAAGWVFSGTNVWLKRCDTRVSIVGRGHYGTDAYRLTGGVNSGTEDCIAESGDDCFPFAPITSTDSANFDQSIVRCSHIRPRGTSYAARGVIAGIDGRQADQMTCSILDCTVIDGYFSDRGGYMVRVSNNRSSGLIHNLRFVRCIFDRSGDLGAEVQSSINIQVDPTNNGHAVPGALTVGGIGDVYFEDCKHIAGPTGACFDIDLGKKLGDGTFLEPTTRARVYINGGEWTGLQFGTIDGKVDLYVGRKTKATATGGSGHVVRIGLDNRAGVIDLDMLDVTGVPTGFGGVRAINCEKVYAPRKISPAPAATGTVGMWSDATVGITHLPPERDYTTGTQTSGVMALDPAVAQAVSLMAPRGMSFIDSNVATVLTFGTQGPSVVDTTVLTANRTRNLALSGTQRPGDIFEITRTGGDTGGPWLLNIMSGGGSTIGSLAVGQYGRFAWTGTAWMMLFILPRQP